MGKDLKKFLKKHVDGETLIVADAKLGGIIKEKLGIACILNSGAMELMRGVRLQLKDLIGGFTDADIRFVDLAFVFEIFVELTGYD